MLVEYENLPRASIISLEIFGNCHEPYTTTTISLGNRSFFSSPVSISIRGEEATVAAMRTALTDTIDGMKPWYSRIATIDMFSFWFWILIIPFWLALMTIMESSGAPKPSHSIKEMLILMGISVTVVAFSQAVIQRINQFLKSLFPVSTFAIGQGMARHHHYEQVRWVVIIGFLVSVVASILVTILQTIYQCHQFRHCING